MPPGLDIQQGMGAGHQTQGREEIEGQGAGNVVGARGTDANVLRSARDTAGYNAYGKGSPQDGIGHEDPGGVQGRCTLGGRCAIPING